MTRYSSIKKLAVAIFAMLLVFLLAGTGFGQNKPAAKVAAAGAQQPLAATIVKLKPGMDLEWESFVKQNLIPALKKSGTQWMATFKTNVFGEEGTYLFFWSFKNMAELDAPDPMLKEMGPDGLALMLSVSQRMVASSRTVMISPVPDLTIPAKQGYQTKMGVLATVSVDPGRQQDYVKNAKEMVTVVAKTNAKAVITGSVGLGGNPNQYLMFVAFDSFADLGEFPQAMAKAAAEAKLAQQPENVEHVEYMVIKMDPELSILQAGQ
jgi:hypothetical protein